MPHRFLRLSHSPVRKFRSGGRGGTLYVAGTAVLENSKVINSSTQGGNGGAQTYFDFDTFETSYNRGNGGNGLGGAIYNTGTLTLSEVLQWQLCIWRIGWIANGTSGNPGVGRGGIYKNGTLTVNESTISGGAALEGAGLYNTASVTVNNTTLANNTATTGGAIYNQSGTVNLDSCTVSSNSGGTSGGAYNAAGATLQAVNSIIAGNTSDNIQNNGTFTDSGHNLLSGDPGLGSLKDNRGPTHTMQPQPGNPALDSGETTLFTDQRGLARPQGSADEIGSVEVSDSSAAAPVFQSITPGNISGAAGDAVSFTTSYSDANGNTNIAQARLRASLGATDTIFAYYDNRNNLLYLRNDAIQPGWVGLLRGVQHYQQWPGQLDLCQRCSFPSRANALNVLMELHPTSYFSATRALPLCAG